jgi:hypothetical protein
MGLHEAAAHVVGTGAAPGQCHDLFGGAGPQAQHPSPEGHFDVLAQGALAGADGVLQHLDHAHVTFELGHGGVVDATDPDLGHQAGHGREAHAGLAQ